jgi:hypothetical protein
VYQPGAKGFTSPKWRGYPATEAASTPEIEIRQPATTSLVDGSARKGFGTARVGTSGTTKTFKIANSGASTLTGIKVSLSGEGATDFIIAGTTENSVAPRSGTSFKVTFKPTVSGTRAARIVIESNDADENPFDIYISGLGVVP